MARPHVLITGFGPFPGATENSSAWLVETLAASRLSSRLNCTLHAEVLPTEWAEVATLGPRLFNQHRPRVMLHLGLNKRARGFRIERTARNLIDPNEDARGAMPSTRSVLERGRALLDTRLSAPNLVKHLRAQGLPAAASRSAGTYLCNYLYYLSLDWARRQEAPCDVCFVHIPPGPGQGGPLSETALLRGADQIVRYLLAFAEECDGAAVAGRKGSSGRATARPIWR